MLKKIILLLTAATLYSAEITNIVVQQRTDGSGIIEVTYDLIDNEGIYPSFNISLEMSIDGEEYSTVNPYSVNGDTGENVIPGTGKMIEIQAPGETYSTNVVIKIIASASVVTGELPFNMISISSIEGVSSYQGETINYNFQIMQNEFTNADLVTFLETYDFDLDDDGNPTYDCSNYIQYINTGVYEDEIHGCTDPEALNYNPSANYDDNYCIWSEDIGCTNSNAWNFDTSADYNDCTCYSINTWTNLGPTACPWDYYLNSLNGTQYDQMVYVNNNDSYNFQVSCTDPSALNYAEDIIQICNDINNAGNNCCTIESSNECVYECDESYLDQNYQDYGNTELGYVNIEDFSTQDISFQGASFVIESGAGTKPALFNYDNCVDGVIVSLLLDYYGLRIPTGEEWTKAARQDNNRCWPWLSDNCENTNLAYCTSLYTCMSQEEFDACEDTISENFNSCQDDCNDAMWDCQADCQDSFEDTGGSEDTCTACMMNPENYMNCSSGPCEGECPCCNDCNGGGGDGADMECFQGCDSTDCNQECGDTFGNSWEICGGEDMNECNNEFNNCTNSWSYDSCISSDQGYILNELGDGPNDSDQYGFNAFVYYNKFHNTYENNFLEGWDNQYLNVTDIAQYPQGISSFGLYDMIGNAPEIVSFNNSLWSVGLNPYSSYVNSFCSNNNNIFDTNDESHATSLSDFTLYALRLARTTQ